MRKSLALVWLGVACGLGVSAALGQGIGVNAGVNGKAPPQPQQPVIQVTPFDGAGTLAGAKGNVLALLLANKQTWQVLIDSPQFGPQSQTQMELRAPARLGMLQSGRLVRFSAMLDESGRHKGLVEQLAVFTPTPETRAGVFSEEQLAAGPDAAQAGSDRPQRKKEGKYFIVGEVNRLRDDVLIVKLPTKPMSFKLAPDVQLTAEFTDKTAIGQLLKEGDPIHVVGFYKDDGTVFAQKIKIDLPRAIGEESIGRLRKQDLNRGGAGVAAPREPQSPFVPEEAAAETATEPAAPAPVRVLKIN